MKTVNLNAHCLTIEHKLSTSTFNVVIDGTTPGRKLKRVRIACDGPLWVEEFARKIHEYLSHEQKKLDAAKAAMENK